MFYYSTSDKKVKANFREATLKGQAPNKGLYFPEEIPSIPNGVIEEIEIYSRREIALQIIQPYTGDTIPARKLNEIVEETIDFHFPLVKINDQISTLELFHGPTLAFKDVGARFMSRCLGYFVQDYNKKVTVLVATSGDTGGAVANGFYDVDGINVVILYPSGKVSSIQELQLTTLGKNITALEIEGTFDDCQQMVKRAFEDKELNRELFLTSANSINVARWLPQQFYYFFAYKDWKDKERSPVISVPSGNFGNICAGLLAHRSGLPVQHFVAACNANDIVPLYLETGTYQSKQAVGTLSNAMDVGDPSNFVRILEIFNNEFHSLKNVLSSYTISDKETRKTIEDVHEKYDYLLDPHGAVGYLALQRYLKNHPEQKGYFLETAHPIKFYDVIEPIIHKKIELPDAVQSLIGEEKRSIRLKGEYNLFKEFLREGVSVK
jgi:threonine synthase